MSKQPRVARMRLIRWLTLNRSPGGVSVTVGVPGRRLPIIRRRLALRLEVPGTGISSTQRRSWQ